MSGIDNRVVKMTFDNRSFERGVSETMSTLDKLKKALGFKDGKKGFEDISKAAGQFDGSKMAGAVENISSKFSALGAIGFTVIQSLTNSALGFAKKVAGNLLEPLVGGGKQRALNLEQAEFMLQGAGLDVKATMESALAAVDGTAFGLDAAAKVAGQFGASGIQAGEQMTTALRAIAGVAGMTGTSYEAMGDIFTTAAGKGVVGNMELRRIEIQGLAATQALADAFGVTSEEVKKMARNGEISFEDFAQAMDDAFGENAQKANETYTGSLANLRTAIGRIGAMYYGPQMEQQRDLFNSMSEVVKKLATAFEPLIEVMVGLRGIGNRKLIGFLDNIDLSGFTEAMLNVGAALVYVYDFIQTIMTIGKDAFREIFPPSSTSIILKLSEFLLKLTTSLKMGGETTSKLGKIFRGFFSVVKIGWEILKGLGSVVMSVVGVFKNLITSVFNIPGGFLSGAAGVGELVFKFQEMLVAGGGIERFFTKIRNGIEAFERVLVTASEKVKEFVGSLELGDKFTKLISFLGIATDKVREFFKSLDIGDKFTKALDSVRNAFSNLFGGKDGPEGAEKTASLMDRIRERLSGLSTVGEKVKAIFSSIGDAFSTAFSKIGDAVGSIDLGGFFESVGEQLQNGFNSSTFKGILTAIGAGVIFKLASGFKNFAKGFKTISKDGLKISLFSEFDKIFGKLGDTLEAFQLKLKAEALKQIAIAIAILVAALLVLSFIDPIKIASGLGAIGYGMLVLVGALKILDGLKSTSKNVLKLAASMVLLSVAALILAFAIRTLSSLDPGELATGLIGVGVAIGILVGAAKLLEKSNESFIKTGVSLIVLSGALWVFSRVIKSFGEMDTETLIQGLLAVFAALAMFTAVEHFVDGDKIAKIGISFAAFGIGLWGIQKVVKAFADIPYEELQKGFVSLAIALALVVIAAEYLPDDLDKKAVGMLVMAGALGVITIAVERLGQIGLWELIKGLGAIGIMLAMMVTAVNMMTGAATGAANMVIVAAALMVLAQVMKVLGELSVGQIVASLAALAGMLIILGVGALIMTPVIPILALLGVAVALLGAGLLMFGAGALLAAKAFVMLAGAGTVGVAALVAALFTLAKVLPEIIAIFIGGLGKVIEALIGLIPTFTDAIKEMLISVLGIVQELVPHIVETLGAIISGALTLIREKVPEMMLVGFEILTAFMTGVRDNMEELATLAVEILTNFINGVTANIELLVTAGADFIVAFINGIADNIQSVIDAGVNLLVSFILGLASRIGDIVGAVAILIITFLNKIADWIPFVIQAGVNLIVQMIEGFKGAIGQIGDAVNDFFTNPRDGLFKKLEDWWEDLKDKGIELAKRILEGLVDDAIDFAKFAGEMIIKLLNGIEDFIRTDGKRIRDAAGGVAGAIIDGIVEGIGDGVGLVKNAITGLASKAINFFKGSEGIDSKSPSKVFVKEGYNIVDGLVLGLQQTSKVSAASKNLANSTIKAFDSAMSGMSSGLEDIGEFNPRIRPVLDLTSVQRDAKSISSMMGSNALSAEVSLGQARAISRMQNTQDTPTETPTPQGPTEINFNQTINAPTALSVSDIYRSTKSQIVLAKEELGIK